ncbi:hypothetical protein LOTGIDRAFT_235120 [Lottia gigantea]|uniref:EF-hand domain-containing protein n=1 Tax=Lottia gigantea TaxID=225164 RepID=V3ZXW7_LOTGI|nr:hypothetical protein LOTGIDRAFT_235120 [Lottia gigantea]ESO87465.1 hypothetical protein LOTGIDRAFT_235120 [Lottia gigantea]
MKGTLKVKGSGIPELMSLIKTIRKERQNILNGNITDILKVLSTTSCFKQDTLKEFLDDLLDDDVDGDDNTDDDDSDQSKDDVDEDDGILENLEVESIKCLSSSLHEETISKLCRHFSRGRGIKSFKRLLAAGIKCVRHIVSIGGNGDDDDDDGDDIDEAQQELIIDQLKKKRVEDWNDDDFEEAVLGAPDMIDDDIIDDLDDDIFQKKIDALGKLLKKGKGRPGLGLAIQQKLRKIKPIQDMTAADINMIGVGIRALDTDDIDEMDDDALEDSDLDFDIDDDEPLGLAIGRKLKNKNRAPGLLNAASVKKLFKFIKSDRNYIQKLNPQALADALDTIGLEDLDDDEAALICEKIQESDDYDEPGSLTSVQIGRLGNVLKGCGEEYIRGLPKSAVKLNLEKIANLDLDVSEARELYKKMEFGEPNSFNAEMMKHMKKLFKALRSDEIDDIDDAVFGDNLDILDEFDLDDAAEQLMIEKIKSANAGKLPTAVLKSKHHQEALSLDDLEDLDDNALTVELEELGQVDWEPSLAARLVEKLKKMENKKFGARDLERLGKLAVGLGEDDIEDLIEDREEILASASVLGDHDDDLTDGQSEAMAEKVKKVIGTVDLDEIDSIRAGPFIIYLDDDEIDEIKFTPKGGKAFVNALAKLKANKIDLLKLKYLVMKSKQLLKAANNDNNDDLSAEEIREMVGSLLGMDEDDIRKLSKAALMGNLMAFSKLPVTKEQAEAILDKVEEYDPEYKCKSDRLAQLGNILRYLSEDKIKALCKSETAAAVSAIVKNIEVVKEAREERKKNGLGREEKDDGEGNIKPLVEKLKDSLESEPVSVRRRRATSSTLTCDQVKTMGKQATKLSVEEFNNMAANEFSNCLGTFGQLSDWSDAHLNVLLTRAETAVYAHTTWNADTIIRLGSIIAGLKPEQMNKLDLSTIDTMSSSGKHGLMSMEQLKSGFKRWLALSKTNDASSITGQELFSLTEYVCGAEPAHISQITVAAFKHAMKPIGEAKSCTLEQLKAYTKRAVAAYGGQINTWEPSVINHLGRTIGGFESSHVSQLQSNQINVIKTDVIPTLPTEMLKAFSVDQLKHFSTNQANALTKAQYDSLEPSQKKVIDAKATVTFDHSGPNGSAGVSNLSVIVVMILSMVPLLF